MPEAAATVLTLQRCLAALALEPETAAFEADPGAFAAGQGLSARHQAAFQRSRARMLFYRYGVRQAIWEPVDTYLPLTRAALRPEGGWQAVCDAFLAARALSSPFYRDIAPTLLGWIAETGWGLERWPFLLELMHFELVQELVEHRPDPPPATGLEPVPTLARRLQLAPSSLVLSYGHAVHEATLEQPVPPVRACHLLAYRDGDGLMLWREVNGPMAALLVRAQTETLGEACAGLGLGADPGLLTQLAELRADGALQGFA
jgi:hypothetical protein